MSVWPYLFDSEYKQRHDIERLKDISTRSNAMLRRKAKLADERIELLEQEVGELTLLCRSLLTVLREAELVDPAELQAVMERIDAEDGVIDGRVTPEHERPKPKPKITAPKRKRRRR